MQLRALVFTAAVLCAGCDTAELTPPETVLPPGACGTAPATTADFFPVAADTTWTFDWTIQRSGSNGSEQSFTGTTTWRFGSPTCQGGTRTVPFVQTSSLSAELPAGALVQSGSEVMLTYATLDRSIVRAAPREASGPGLRALPTVCTAGTPPDTCNALSLQAGRGVVGVEYATTHRVSTVLYTDRGVFSRID